MNQQNRYKVNCESSTSNADLTVYSNRRHFDLFSIQHYLSIYIDAKQ